MAVMMVMMIVAVPGWKLSGQGKLLLWDLLLRLQGTRIIWANHRAILGVTSLGPFR